jgi:uncharacterized protein (UPF0335 family)
MPKAQRTDIEDDTDVVHKISNVDVKSYAKRLEALLDEQESTRLCIKDLKAEAKANGVAPKALADAVRIKRKGVDTDHAMLVEAYLKAIGGSV